MEVFEVGKKALYYKFCPKLHVHLQYWIFIWNSKTHTHKAWFHVIWNKYGVAFHPSSLCVINIISIPIYKGNTSPLSEINESQRWESSSMSPWWVSHSHNLKGISEMETRCTDDIWSFHDSEDPSCLLGCDTMCYNRIPMFQRTLLSPSSVYCKITEHQSPEDHDLNSDVQSMSTSTVQIAICSLDR
jgi:hypothetical protein